MGLAQVPAQRRQSVIRLLLNLLVQGSQPRHRLAALPVPHQPLGMPDFAANTVCPIRTKLVPCASHRFLGCVEFHRYVKPIKYPAADEMTTLGGLREFTRPVA